MLLLLSLSMEYKMEVEFCPICGAFMNQVPMVIGGETFMFWVCEEGDYEAPVYNLKTVEEPTEEM